MCRAYGWRKIIQGNIRNKTLASDVIGFTTNGNVGSNGIEASYNSILNGTDGREYGYLDESSGFERTVKEPDKGSTVVSTIDLQGAEYCRNSIYLHLTKNTRMKRQREKEVRIPE